MIRTIQATATLTALLFSVGALFDLMMADIGKLDATTIVGGAFPLTRLPFTSVISGAITILLAVLLVGAALVAQISVRASRRATAMRLDGWRRLTWGASVIETTGALLFVFNGTLLFVPAAMALLLVGVAELATIWHDMEHRAEHIARTVFSREHRVRP